MNGSNQLKPASSEEIERALFYIPATIPEEEWWQICSALKNEGIDFSVFDSWSSGHPSYNPKETRQKWSHSKPSRFSFGTIQHYAKQYGYEFKSDTDIDYEAIAKHKEEQQAKIAQHEKETLEKAKIVAIESAKMWATAKNSDDTHNYLVKKQIQSYGLKKDNRGNLIVPFFNANYEVVAIQTITPQGEKFFSENAKISGCFFVIGEVFPDCEIYVTEGYATGATIHQLTGCPVYIAFFEGNLSAVCQFVRSQYESRTIIVCADNDYVYKDGSYRPPEKNTGVVSATKAANLINAQLRVPQCTGTDFNDCFIEFGRDVAMNQLFNVEKINQPIQESDYFNVEHAEKVLVDLSDTRQVNEFTESLLSRIGDNENELDVINIVVNEIAHNCIEFDKTVADYIVGQIVKKDAFRTKKTVLKTGIIARFKTEKKEIRKKIKQDFVPIDKQLIKEQFPDLVDADNGATIIATTKSNLKHILKSYGIVAVYDEAIKAQEIIMPNSDNLRHDLYREAALQDIRSLASLNNVRQSITDLIPTIMIENTVNPVKDWILSKEWDGKQRVIELSNTLIIEDKEKNELKNKILFTWLVQSVAALDRAKIGCELNKYAKPKFELILILQARQGLTKTTWFTNLLPREIEIEDSNGNKKTMEFSNRYIRDGSNLALDNKDSIKQNISCWINELGELDATFRKSDIAALKAFCSNQTDTIRLPFARSECDFKRATSFCASVNDGNFLNDPTGSRRMGVISLSGIIENHGIDMQQLWREVWDYYADGEVWWLDKETETAMQENNRINHQSTNPIEDAIMSVFNWDQPSQFWVNRMTATEIYKSCFDKSGIPAMKDLNAIRPVLVEQGVKFQPYRNKTAYFMPEKLT